MKQKMTGLSNSVKVSLIISATVIVLALIGMFFYFQIKPTNTVNVNGEAQIEVVPDKVGVYFYIDTKGSTASEAKDANSEIYDSFLTALIKEGFNREDVQTISYSINPLYDWTTGKQKLIGYQALYYIKVDMLTEDRDKIGEAIDAGVDAGALLQWINFELSQEKQNEYKALALKQATQDAKVRAESIASGLGKKVGRIVSMSDSSFDYYPWRLYESSGGSSDAAMAKEATTNIQPGNQDINARVSVVFAIV